MMADCDVTFVFDSQERSRSRAEREKLQSRGGSRLKIIDMDDEDSVEEIRAPIIGYEVIEQRQRFTVYKIQVIIQGKSWFVFRRYTDFERLNERSSHFMTETPALLTTSVALKNIKFRLPGKRWFKDNYDPDFIEERARKLQLFISSLLNHADISRSSKAVKEFFCIDDPPGPYDSLEESRAYCQFLEDQLEVAKQKVSELESELSATKSQLAQARVQQEALVSSLRAERQFKGSQGRLHEDSANGDVQQAFRSSYFRKINGSRGNWRKSWDGGTENQPGWQENLEVSAGAAGIERVKPTPLSGKLPAGGDSPISRDVDTSNSASQPLEAIQSPPSGSDDDHVRTSTPIDKEKVGLSLSNAGEDRLTTEHDFANGTLEKETCENHPKSFDERHDLGVSSKCVPDSSDSKPQEGSHRTKGTSNKKHLLEGSGEHVVRNLKRDSGIIIDQSPTPST